LDAVVPGQDEEESCLHELLPDESLAEPSEALEEGELKSRLAGALLALPERERLILSLYYYEELTFKEIGAVLEVSESRVCQLHGRAVMTLKARLRSDLAGEPEAEMAISTGMRRK
jgi:RNA polymerase sigma factor for flagellar operon FliA